MCVQYVGDIMINVGDMLSTVGDIMSTMEGGGVFSTVGKNPSLFEYLHGTEHPHGTEHTLNRVVNQENIHNIYCYSWCIS